MSTYKMAYLCGVTKGHERIFIDAERTLNLQGYICVTVIHDDETEDCAFDFELYRSSILVIITPDHINEKMKQTIKEAMNRKIPVYTYSNGELIKYNEHCSKIVSQFTDTIRQLEKIMKEFNTIGDHDDTALAVSNGIAIALAKFQKTDVEKLYS